MKITHSMLNAYDFCPRSYHLRYELLLEAPPTEAMIVGLYIHQKIANKFGKGVVNKIAPDLQKKADKIYNNWEKTWYPIFKDDVQYMAFDTAIIENVEKYFDVDFYGDNLVGIVDFITKDNVGIDWKTGKYVSPTQLALYMYAMKLPKAMYIFLRATNRGQQTFEMDKYDYNGGILFAKQSITKIKKRIFIKNEWACPYCSYKEICDKMPIDKNEKSAIL